MANDKKTELLGLNRAELSLLCEKLGQSSFRGKQIAEWLYKKNAASFGEMTNLSKPLREALDKRFEINSVRLTGEHKAGDGTRKFALALGDGNTIESVLIPADDRLTLCVSSQAGCKLRCRFCLTGRGGFTRNLETGEIVLGDSSEKLAMNPQVKKAYLGGK